MSAPRDRPVGTALGEIHRRRHLCLDARGLFDCDGSGVDNHDTMTLAESFRAGRVEAIDTLPTATDEQAKAAYGEILGLVLAMNEALAESADTAVVGKLDFPAIPVQFAVDPAADPNAPLRAVDANIIIESTTMYLHRPDWLPGAPGKGDIGRKSDELFGRLEEWIVRLYDKMAQISEKLGFQSFSITVGGPLPPTVSLTVTFGPHPPAAATVLPSAG